MIDHIFLSVSNAVRSIDFYTKVLTPLGLTDRIDYDGKLGPVGHADLKGFGRNGRMTFWLRVATPAPGAVHVGFIANSEKEVQAAHAAALAAGATQIHAPGPQPHYDPHYYAAQVKDPDGYSLEFVYKNWQH